MPTKNPIKVSTHVARDFLQNAAYFSTLPKVIWEYVSNSLDNAPEGRPVNVAVEVLSSRIRIADDGMGMSRDDLQSFFQMHGENRQRARGKRVRGRFGTGKCAAFGIANVLQIDTAKDGRRNVVELKRSDIQAAKNGEAFPARDVVIDEPTDQLDGTLIEIRDLNIKRLDIEGTTNYVEHHLSRYRQRARVVINGQECKFEEPEASEIHSIQALPQLAYQIGDVTLIIKVSKVPLESDYNGIDILSHSIWHETTLVGLENKEMSQYLFGEVDVPILEDKEWPIPAFDNTRNNSLNVQNPVVAVLFGWIRSELEKIRQKLVEAERQRRQSEEAKQLEKEAARIAELINEDLEKIRMELEIAKRIAARQGKVQVTPSGSNSDPLPGDGKEPTVWQQAGAQYGNGSRGETPSSGNTPRPGASLIPGSQTGSPKSGEPGSQRRRKGLFSIEYLNESESSHRSRYDRATQTIVINLDHPQIAGTLKAADKNVESRQFRELSCEIAVVEYAVAVQYERIDQEGDQYQASDALYEVREIINRVSRRFAALLNSPQTNRPIQ